MAFFKGLMQKGSGSTEEDLQSCLNRLGHFDIVHEGWLVKRGKLVTNWKRRYFVLLSPGVLAYCEDETAADRLRGVKISNGFGMDTKELQRIVENIIREAKILGTVAINEETMVNRIGHYEEHDNTFTIQAPPPSKRLFYFSAESQDQIDKWEEMIRHMDTFEERQKEKEMKEDEEKERKRQAAIRAKYMKLLPAAKDPYTGGTIRCGEEVWQYTSGGPGDEKASIIEQVEGRHKKLGLKFSWNGTIISMGQVSMVGDSRGGWGLWNGRRFEWRTPASLDRRGRGQAWEYSCDADMKIWRASAFTMRMNFPTAWKFVDEVTLKPENNSQPLEIPSEVTIEGSVPPMIALACGMYNASRTEAIIQTKILKEIQAEEREKRILQEAIEKHMD